MKTQEQIKSGLQSLKARGQQLSEVICAICEKLDVRCDERADFVTEESILATGLVTEIEAAALIFSLSTGTRCDFDSAAHVVNFGW